MRRLLVSIGVASMLVGCGERKPEKDIWTAAATGDNATIERHLAAGTDIDAKDPMGGSSALIVAALYGRTETARLLVRNGARVDSRNNDEATALHVAAFFCHPALVAYLLEQGADPRARNRFGQTPLETVAGEWGSGIEGVYKTVAGLWKLELNLERIREGRPRVAALLRRHAGLGNDG